MGKLKLMSDKKAFKRMIKIFFTQPYKFDEWKTQFNKYFVHLGENETTRHVGVQVPCMDLGADNDNMNTIYRPEMLLDNGDVTSLFFLDD
jgi:phosphoserine aminotransferase